MPLHRHQVRRTIPCRFKAPYRCAILLPFGRKLWCVPYIAIPGPQVRANMGFRFAWWVRYTQTNVCLGGTNVLEITPNR